MELVIPEGAQVHITIGRAPLLALPDETIPERRAARSGNPLWRGALSMALLGVLLGGAFVAGQHLSGSSSAAHPGLAPATGEHARAAERQPPLPWPGEIKPAAGSPTTLPGRPLPSEPAATPSVTEIPPAFRQQLAQPPQVTLLTGQPAPGQPAPG